MEGVLYLTQMLQSGSKTVRELIATDDPHRALAHALWLKGMRHPEGAQLVEEARQAVRDTQSSLTLA